MLGLHAGVNGNFPEYLCELLVAHLAELRAGDGAGIVSEDAEIARDGNGGVDVVAGDHDRADAGLQQRVDQRIVERDALLVHRAHALGDQPRPGDREAIVPDAQLLHQRDVLAEAMHMVAGHVAVVTLQNLARLVGEAVPDGRPLAVLEGSALDLIGRGRCAPDKVLAEAHGVPPVAW